MIKESSNRGCRIMKMIEKISLLLVTSLLVLNLQAAESDHAQHQHAAAAEDDPHAAHKAMMNKPAEAAETTRVDLLDLDLLDQHGKQVKFVSDVIGDRIVVMDFVYTTCTTVCPVLSAVFGQVQKKLGDRLGDRIDGGIGRRSSRRRLRGRAGLGLLRLRRMGRVAIPPTRFGGSVPSAAPRQG